ncbi:MAG: thymidine phosphorylase [Rubrivivax sp.]|nr:thymidine phosphorylase [Rubrivivax sp.]
MQPLVPSEIIRAKRDGQALTREQIAAFVRGLVNGGFADSQAAALAMAILLRGMDEAETAALTGAMARSGQVLDWRALGFHGPVLDKHSTGGVGDKVSLLLAPIVAACGAAAGAVVPMISGRGLAHTGGTLDKLEALPGYTVDQPPGRIAAVLRETGCAIVGASAAIAPADRRLYAIRDVTATVESLPLIVASILSKKLAAGLSALVLDVKTGSGAFMADPAAAQALAAALVGTAAAAGLPARALVTDMNRVLGRSAGNALEVQECLAVLRGEAADARLLAVTLTLAAELLQLGGVAADVAAGEAMARAALAGGAAAERFARMVAALGGPRDVLHDARLPQAPVQRAVPAPCSGWLARCDARALGMVVVALGGGRRRPGDAVDPRVGLAQVRPLGERVAAGDTLAVVHAADDAAADAAVAAVQAALPIADEAPALPPLLVQRLPAVPPAAG